MGMKKKELRRRYKAALRRCKLLRENLDDTALSLYSCQNTLRGINKGVDDRIKALRSAYEHEKAARVKVQNLYREAQAQLHPRARA